MGIEWEEAEGHKNVTLRWCAWDCAQKLHKCKAMHAACRGSAAWAGRLANQQSEPLRQG